MTTAKLSSKYQVTIPKKVVRQLGLESGDELVLEVREREIAFKVPGKVENPTEELYGSLPKRPDAVEAIRGFRSKGGRR